MFHPLEVLNYCFQYEHPNTQLTEVHRTMSYKHNC